MLAPTAAACALLVCASCTSDPSALTSIPALKGQPASGAPVRPAEPDTSAKLKPEESPRQDAEDWEWEDEDWQDEDWEDQEAEEDTGRAFLYWELVLSGFYSPEGVAGVPPDDRSEDHFEFSPRPPGNYVGLDYVRTFTSSSTVNQKFMPGWLSLAAIDLHPRVLFDRMEESDDGDQVEFAPQDFWARFNLGGNDRLTLRVGQFVLPYGVNPILAPRQRFLLPIEATDLGLKWDWGVGVKGPAGEYDWELAATMGSGEALHSPHLFTNSKRQRYLFTGRIGTPTYWDFQYGASFLFGDLPVIRSAKVLSRNSVSRWRVGLDALYKHGTYLMAGAQVTYGQDGFAGDNELVSMTGGDTADVLGYRAWVDWVVPVHTDLRLGAQFESVYRDLPTPNSDDSAVILEVGYSLTTSTSVVLDYRMELNRSMGQENDAGFLTFIYYGM
jgi:hypothetical protein